MVSVSKFNKIGMLLLISLWGLGCLVQNQAYANNSISSHNEPVHCPDEIPSCLPTRAIEKITAYKENDLSTYKMMEYVLNSKYLDDPDNLSLKSEYYLIEAITNRNLTTSTAYKKFIDSDSGQITATDGSVLALTDLPEKLADILSEFSLGQQTCNQHQCNWALFLSEEKNISAQTMLDAINMVDRILLLMDDCRRNLIIDFSEKEKLACCCKAEHRFYKYAEKVFSCWGCHGSDRCDDCSPGMKNMRARKKKANRI